ncbi:MAG: ATP synthase F0 subunit B [Candidatus Portnoybacteria bacterium CG_4_8_14_3_um_filter_44_10]|uniref:ATP synthase subunit b n=4 Tax=Candidatus Portnoyibacteriota TaxID=1817913 RepID=A0A2H0KQ23_9BACT|nr:MAG: ATP synthase F0 subunit B [Parcubacteria group bacterium CG2_30_44_18]PIQ74246.1 MAG: ATP synthase F0 subunit B [Candidatus Portnoybacteria bacterium CG11_big_fil_rev_8_21_14_0_20_44_10]PIS16771.1 MAG: ATP synthase F0 subunit B [Candidatus Portnoybacteria bacterium CG09_land_8_20_14_0_10_44_13]PIW75795.1 MAG: ATP synthase F0 subunit B [Candidatus Portnoybacteria bacterium CG_4_8_14_3_um_filter_44_10]PIZ71863.1 MAG: ATP synthase F0 subunit B [Candidatus Portnoybacteria bacterium CG_4_10_
MEGSSLTAQLGIDWRLLLSQAVNFILLVIVLRLFVYKPVLNILQKRREKIEEGVAKTEEADVRLRKVDDIAKKKVKEAEGEAIGIIKNTEERAQKLEGELVRQAKEKQVQMMEKMSADVEREKEQVRTEMEKEAVDLVKRALVKTVELEPEKIDEELIRKAVEQIG